jgi:hypothetical protein
VAPLSGHSKSRRRSARLGGFLPLRGCNDRPLPLRGGSDRFAPNQSHSSGQMHCPKLPSGAADRRREAFGNEAGPNSMPRWMLVGVGYRMGAITSFPLGEPVLSSSTTAEIASDSGTMRPIAGTSWPRSKASAMSAMHCGFGLPNTR